MDLVKKIACLGDSITQGLDDVTFNYVYYLEKMTGAKVFNFGVNATRIATRLIPHETPSWNDSFLIRVERMTDKYDVILIFAGTNDYSNQLEKIIYDTGENVALTYSNNNISTITETKSGLRSYIYYSYNRPIQITNYSIVGKF